MLKTALKPRWIAGLLAALVVASVFVLLSQWQFGRSGREEVKPDGHLEMTRPLVDTLKPGQFFPGTAADQMVTLSGHYDPAKQVIVKNRLLDGTSGYWVVDALAVDGAPEFPGAKATEQTWIPVARGWIAKPQDATPPPAGKINLTGRLVPSEAPTITHDTFDGTYRDLSVAQLINVWDVASYPGFIGASAEVNAEGTSVAASENSALKPLKLKAATVENGVNWLNIFYAVEWVVFAGFALFIWWRLVKDDYQRQLEDEEDAALAAEAARVNAGQNTKEES